MQIWLTAKYILNNSFFADEHILLPLTICDSCGKSIALTYIKKTTHRNKKKNAIFLFYSTRLHYLCKRKEKGNKKQEK